ncbi:MAG: AAA family ATPase [Sphaerobacter sp.]|nr:AAA family ATPase [Sphaerobacter sp.]
MAVRPLYPPDEDPPLLVGRASEQASLRAALADALSGRGRLVLISGEAGIGKTALARRLCQEAREQGALVLVSHCYDLTETPPYGPWAELVDRGAALLDAPMPPFEETVARTASQLALFAQMRDWLRDLAARQPLVLLLEDLHWADAGSLDLLRFVARGGATEPLLLLVTYRDEEVTRRHPLFPLLPLLVREAGALRIELRRLEPADVQALIAARYQLPGEAESRLMDYLEACARGNPLYIRELLCTLEDEHLLRPAASGWTLGDLAQVRVPTLLRQVIEGRLARLGEDARHLLSVAAVIGQEVPLGLWGAVAGAGEETLLDVVEAAVEAHLLETPADGTAVRFAHALIRETLYDGLLPPRRRLWHRRVAAALMEMPQPGPHAVAYHLLRAGDPRAAEWLIRAGDQAQRAYALLTAGERFDAALQLLEAQGAPPGEQALLLYRVARMRRYADPRQALAYLDDAIALAAAAGDQPLVAYFGCFRGSLRCVVGDIRGGLENLEDGIAAIDALDPDQRARLREQLVRVGDPADEYHYRGALVNWLALSGRCADALALGPRAVAQVPPQGLGTSGYANAWRGVASASAVLGRPDAARRACAEAIAAYRAVEHHYQVGQALLLELYEVVLPYHADDLAERERLAREAEAAWARAGAVVGEALPPRFVWLPLLVLQGAWDEARRLAQAALATDVRTGWRPFARSVLAALARDQGDPELAWRLVREQLPAGLAAEPGDAILLDTLPIQRLAAALALDAGDLPTARAWLESHDRWLAWSDAVLGRADGHLAWAAYYRAAGDLAAARRRAAGALEAASEPRQPLALLRAHRLLGALDTAAQRHDEARSHLDAALTLANACAARYEQALTLLALAEQRAAVRQRAEARELLGAACAILEPLGAAPALARARELAARLTASRAADRVYPAGLTPREVEVLRLVAEGLTDAQVAARLFLSPRTVSQHLRSIYHKLGVSSRAAATRFALEHHLW